MLHGFASKTQGQPSALLGHMNRSLSASSSCHLSEPLIHFVIVQLQLAFFQIAKLKEEAASCIPTSPHQRFSFLL